MDKAGLGFALLVVVYANTCISERWLDCEALKKIQLKDLKIKELNEENEKLKKGLRECKSLKQKVKKCRNGLEKLKKQIN